MHSESVKRRFDKKWVPEPNSGCWLWTASDDGKGYGQFGGTPRPNGRADGMRKAYKVGYEIYVGPVPEGLELDHKCRTKMCVNPDHLEPVTHGVNIDRGVWQPAINKKKTHCDRGHPYTEDNFKIYKGSRKCMECNKITCLARYYRLKAEAC